MNSSGPDVFIQHMFGSCPNYSSQSENIFETRQDRIQCVQLLRFIHYTHTLQAMTII